jgi:hypothetical protein
MFKSLVIPPTHRYASLMTSSLSESEVLITQMLARSQQVCEELCTRVGVVRPIQHFVVTLSPRLMLALAERHWSIPAEYNGFPVKIAEGPSRINKPTGCYMINAHAWVADGHRVRSSGGAVCLDNPGGVLDGVFTTVL